jgi:hypothetical protein
VCPTPLPALVLQDGGFPGISALKAGLSTLKAAASSVVAAVQSVLGGGGSSVLPPPPPPPPQTQASLVLQRPEHRGDPTSLLSPPLRVPLAPPLPAKALAEAGRLEAVYALTVDPELPAIASGEWDGGQSAAFLKARKELGLDPPSLAAEEKAAKKAFVRSIERLPKSKPPENASWPNATAASPLLPVPPPSPLASPLLPPPPSAISVPLAPIPPPFPVFMEMAAAAAQPPVATPRSGRSKTSFMVFPDALYGTPRAPASDGAESGKASAPPPNSCLYLYGGSTVSGVAFGDHYILHLAGSGDSLVAEWELLIDMNSGPEAREGAAAVVVTSDPVDSGVRSYGKAIARYHAAVAAAAGAGGDDPYKYVYPPYPAPRSQWILLMGGAQRAAPVIVATQPMADEPPSLASLVSAAMDQVAGEQ